MILLILQITKNTFLMRTTDLIYSCVVCYIRFRLFDIRTERSVIRCYIDKTVMLAKIMINITSSSHIFQLSK